MFVGESFYTATPVWSANFGNPSFSISSGNSDDNGYGNFEYAPPTGFLSLCTQNLATELSPTIDDGSLYQNQVLYTGNGTAGTAITGLGFQPDWVWIKNRTDTGSSHLLADSSRGANQRLRSDTTNAEDSLGIDGFDSDGFSLTSGGNQNSSGKSYVGWCWKANAGSTSSNTDGSITSTVQANTTAGFSIVTYTGTGSAGTVGHGLSATPDAFFVKSRTNAETWRCWFNSFTGGNNIRLDSTAAVETDINVWNNSLPTSTLLNLGSSGSSNGSSQTYVAYCFTSIEGYSKFGKYTGNASDDGPFVYTGFRPAWIMYKNISRSTAGAIWWMWDTTRDTRNPTDLFLRGNDSLAEGSFDSLDILSNGFKLRTSDGGQNASGETIIYMAFAESPFVTSTGIPVTAR